MPLVRLLYASRVPSGFGPNEMQSILDAARKNNPALGVTGLLCTDSEHFLQWLEGPARGVNEVFRHIARDDRHEELTLLDYRPVTARAFDRWSMAYVSTDDVADETLYRYSETRDFDPLLLGPDAAAALLVELAEVARTTLEGRKGRAGS